MKVASATIRRILIDTESSDCLRKLTYPGRDIVPLVHPILGFGRQEVNPTRMIRLPLRFREKVKAKNLEVDFLVVDVPMAYNIILGLPTLYKLKAVIASYLLKLQFEANDGSLGMMQGDQRTAQECYLHQYPERKDKKKNQNPRGALNVRVFVMVTFFGYPISVAFGVRARGLAI
ncbi:hypothetical protein Cgig2_022428 [Carnegiea gigantea]|uniref:Uncharacterized protein n=1 Tax=Carnegiea gigantea TaxID=171969 RepID=A0A9Q1JKN2_9CARY|nr:hypothetical protein Cgig2_022428 [Carnegiea gigantea]